MKKAGLITLIIIDVFAAICFFVFYGPIKDYRELIITRAMISKSHKYIARTFYSSDMINNVLSSNYVNEATEKTDENAIDFKIDKEYKDIYDEQILTKDPGNDLYKVIDINTKRYRGYIGVIYDPSRINLLTSTNQRGNKVNQFAKEHNAKLAINGGGFIDIEGTDDGGTPVGVVIKDGKLLSNLKNPTTTGGIAGFNKDNVLILTKDSPQKAIANGLVNGVEFGPFLMTNGNPAKVYGNGGTGRAARTVLAQRQDGIVLFIVIDGKNLYLPGAGQVGADMNDLIELLVKYRAYNAVNLDGGSSSSLNVNGEVYSKPCAMVDYSGTKFGERRVPNAWILK